MKTYETIATVEDEGQVHIAGVPFAPGTEVDITIVPTVNGTDATAAASRAEQLFAALDNARNTASVGPLNREELYDRKVFR